MTPDEQYEKARDNRAKGLSGFTLNTAVQFSDWSREYTKKEYEEKFLNGDWTFLGLTPTQIYELKKFYLANTGERPEDAIKRTEE